MNDGELALTLLKSASSPEMRADNRVHTFTYAITAWEGSFAESNALYEGLALNVPARVSTGTGEDFSLAAVDSKNIIIDTIKPAEDGSGDIIIRMYEGMKMDTYACVTSMLFSGNVYSCNMLEEVEEQLNALDGKLELHFRPFEIKTIRITK
jgi:alpha-mannosidase